VRYSSISVRFENMFDFGIPDLGSGGTSRKVDHLSHFSNMKLL
jgi:hypothetical protein